MNEKRKIFTIPKGYSADDTKDRLKWLKETTGFDYKSHLENQPDELKGIIENHIAVSYTHLTLPTKRIV